MGKRFITVLTLIAVMLHVLLGCCWHHGHGVAHHEFGGNETSTAMAGRLVEGNRDAFAPPTRHCSCMHGEHAPASTEDLPPSEQRPQSRCDANACVFYAASDASQAFVKKAGWPSSAVNRAAFRPLILQSRLATSPMSSVECRPLWNLRAQIQVWRI